MVPMLPFLRSHRRFDISHDRQKYDRQKYGRTEVPHAGVDMIRSYWYLAALAGGLGMAAGGPYGTPILVLCLAVGIFFGTVSLRGHRAQDATSTHPGV